MVDRRAGADVPLLEDRTHPLHSDSANSRRDPDVVFACDHGVLL
jgi:hypothetical protein